MNALVSSAASRALDKEASAHWGLNSSGLVEAAGRACARAFTQIYGDIEERRNLPRRNTEEEKNINTPCSPSCPQDSSTPWFTLPRHPLSLAVLAGKGNNAADALVMLKALILDGFVQASACVVFSLQTADSSEALLAVEKLGVTVFAWDDSAAARLAHVDYIIDGIAGTGLDGPLRGGGSAGGGCAGGALEMATACNAAAANVATNNSTAKAAAPCVVSIDMPSGNFDGWQAGMPIVAARFTLAIEPQKLCLYNPSARPYAGNIIPVGGIFPPALIEQYREAELVEWENASAQISIIPKTAHKYERGLVEIRAGSPGYAGAAYLAALGAQSAGAGLVRLMVDPSLYPLIAPGCSGIMVVPDGATDDEDGRFPPHAVLLGPGWGRGDDRRRLLESYLPLEESGVPLILDADAIALVKDMVFHGNTLITPHPGEFSAYTGIPKDEILNNPLPILRRFASEKKMHILLKGHVLYAASPDGRVGIIDGMNPALATGGTGDLLAGFCAAISARAGIAHASRAAASLLIQAAESETVVGRFIDPADLAKAAAAVAGSAWLPMEIV
jgi:NAD(P)H-hydrate epimerase